MVTRLQAQQAFLQDLVNGIPDPVLVIGPEWKIRIANSAYSELIGLEPGMPVDGTCYRVGRGLDTPCPNTLVSCPHAITLSSPGTLAGKGESSTRTVMTLRHRDGHDIPVEIDSARLTCEGQVFTVEVLRPLNEAIRFSQEMRLSTIGLLANGVAHEIHNPLASIRLALQASLRELKRQHVNTAELTGYLQVVDSQIDRCVATTQRLMQMSALPNEELVPVSLGSALEDVTTLLGEDARQRHVRIECLPQARDVWLMADPAELRQIFFNLLHNAMNALPHGGRVRIDGEPTPDGHAYRLRVSDTGVGIAPENLARVFLPFFSRRADGRAGMGLGLAVCKSIVDRFGGAIEVRSELGQGSTFTVTIPMASARPSPGDERGAEPRVSTQLP